MWGLALSKVVISISLVLQAFICKSVKYFIGKHYQHNISIFRHSYQEEEISALETSWCPAGRSTKHLRDRVSGINLEPPPQPLTKIHPSLASTCSHGPQWWLLKAD